MSQPNAAQQAIEALEHQLTELNGIRNATPRDPSFKNWRQGSLTLMQRIWPSDQDRQERFRRIPFSPADPRADARTTREWYSRGCQEAAHVLSGFIADIRAQGVPVQAADVASPAPSSGDFGVDFPTVDLPSGDLGSTGTAAEVSDEILLAPVSEGTPRVPIVPVLQQPIAPTPTVPVRAPSVYATYRPAAPAPMPTQAATPAPAVNPAPAAPQTPTLAQRAPSAATPVDEPRTAPQQRKGMGARLRDLLGFAQLSAKAFTSMGPPSASPSQPLLSSEHAPVPPPRPSLEIVPVGEDVTARPAPAAPQQAVPAIAPPTPQPIAPPVAATSAPPPVESAPAAPPAEEVHEPGKSVVMSRPTLLRGNIEKVSIESLISPEFRSEQPASAPDPLDAPHLRPVGSAEGAAPPAPAEPVAPALPAPTAAAAPTPSGVIATPLAPPLDTEPTPSSEMLAPPASILTPSRMMPAPSAADLPPKPPSTIIPLPTLPKLPGADAASGTGEKTTSPASRGKREAASKVLPFSRRQEPVAEQPASEQPVEARDTEPSVDPEEFAAATEDFMRTSPVLGATGRRVKRGYDDRANDATAHEDPDAIAVIGMQDELEELGVPKSRQKEARARLSDLAKRIEKGELDWTALRKAVWFAMEYPDVARRLMPLLLPWIDRAA